jgi:UDP-N-acetyl-2-amino-2-deoxyglucuronate dehydrogenase
MAKTYGVGLVGTGEISMSHVTAFRALDPRFRLVAVADTDQFRLRSFAQKAFVPFSTTDYRNLLERADVDVIDVCTPPGVHKQIVSDALAAGKHVVCEKPLAPTLRETDELIEVASRFPGKLSTVYQRRYFPEIRSLVQQVEDGRFGTLVAGRFTRYAAGAFSKGKGWWGSWQIAGGGTVMTQFVHELDVMRLVFGEPESVVAEVDTLHLEIESDDTFGAIVRFKNGAVVTCTSATGVGKSGASFEVIGTKEVYRFSSDARGKKPSGVAGLRAKAEKAMKVAENRWRAHRGQPVKFTGDGGTHRGYFEAIAAALDMGQPLPVGPEESRHPIELATAIYAAGMTGTRVRFPIDATCPIYGGVSATEYAMHTRRAHTNGAAVERRI